MFKEFPYKIPALLKRKLDLMIGLLNQDDVWIIIDGDEGSGKTNMAAFLMYYFHCATGRPFEHNASQFYFDTEELVNFAKDHKEQIINWDEAALGGLSIEWWSTSQRNLIKLAMTGRKKHHIFILCIPKAIKLVEYLREDRSHALIHMHTGRSKNEKGHYMYLTRRGKRKLFNLWMKKKIRAYKKFSSFAFGGHYGYIPYVLDEIVDVNAYNDKKDKAISNIGNKKGSKEHQEIKILKHKIGLVRPPIKNRKELAEKLEIDVKTLERWGKSLENEEKDTDKAT